MSFAGALNSSAGARSRRAVILLSRWSGFEIPSTSSSRTVYTPSLSTTRVTSCCLGSSSTLSLGCWPVLIWSEPALIGLFVVSFSVAIVSAGARTSPFVSSSTRSTHPAARVYDGKW